MSTTPIATPRLAAHPGVQSLAFFAALAVACLLFGAIPWLTVPTLGQALWASGFAQSYANAGWFAIHAGEFGLPTPAPISFGLSATFVQGLLIRIFGIAAVDAYTLTAVLYLALALYGAAVMARLLGASFYPSLAIGLLWLTLPLVWNHVSYSMLALGFALLPFYLYSTCRLLVARNGFGDASSAALFVVACVIAVFMDGYTFMMFVAAATITWLGAWVSESSSRRRIVVFALPCMIAGFTLAYVLYTSFIGTHQYKSSPLDFFRGWGVDVTMLLWPTRGIHWLWDAIGLGTARNDQLFWGDGSVWITTFLAPLLVTGVCGYVAARRHPRATSLLCMALIGLYLALGPSLKVDSTKRVTGIPQTDSGPLMPEQYARMPTGSGWLSTNMPGFRDMRAAYRWAGLGALGLWGLTALLLIRLHQRRPSLAYATALLLIVAFFPHLDRTVRNAVAHRKQAESITEVLGTDLREAAGEHGTLFFAPHGNDFIVNYLAATSGFRSHNIGGDKNVEMAQLAWSEPMRALNLANLSSTQFSHNLRSLLLVGTADAVILPYFDMLWAAHRWPPSDASVHTLREQRLPTAEAAAASPCFQIQEFPLFAAISLSETGRRQREALVGSERTLLAAAEACRLAD